jgi:hypothetical protein
MMEVCISHMRMRTEFNSAVRAPKICAKSRSSACFEPLACVLCITFRSILDVRGLFIHTGTRADFIPYGTRAQVKKLEDKIKKEQKASAFDEREFTDLLGKIFS